MWILGFKDAKKICPLLKGRSLTIWAFVVHYFWHQDSGAPCILSALFMQNSPAFSLEFHVTAQPHTCSSM